MRPLFLLTKSERMRAIQADSFEGIECEYRDIFRTIYQWDLPFDACDDFCELTLYDDGGLGLAEDGLLYPAVPSKWDAQGNIVEWLPIVKSGGLPVPTDVNTPQEGPCLFMEPMKMILDGYIKTLQHAHKSIIQNARGMRQPILLRSTTGKTSVTYMVDALDNPDIPYIEGTSVEVLDMGVSDFTTPLCNLIEAGNNWVLSAMGLDSSAVQKASGMNVAEVTMGNKTLKAKLDHGLERRQRFAEQCSAEGVAVSVKMNPAYEQKEIEEDDVQSYRRRTFEQ